MKKYPSEETGKALENPKNDPHWEPYDGHCPCASQWLEGFVWGRGRKENDSRLSFVVSTRPFPIIERLKRTLEEEGFVVSERTTDEPGHDALVITARRADIREWRLPPFTSRRLGTDASNEFLAGFLDSRMRPHMYGLAVPGRSWVPDLKELLERRGYKVRTYDGVLTVSRSQAKRGMLQRFARSLVIESEYYAELTGEDSEDDDTEAQTEQAYLKVRQRMSEYIEPWPDDWFACCLLALQLESIDPMSIEMTRVGSPRIMGRMLEAIIARRLWFRIEGTKLSVSLNPPLHDWLKTNTLQSVRFGPGGLAGALAVHAISCNGESIIIKETTGSRLFHFLAEKANEAYFDVPNRQDGSMELRNRVLLNPTFEKLRGLFEDGPSHEFEGAITSGAVSSHPTLSDNEMDILRKERASLWGEHLFSYLSSRPQIQS